jgi:hypothetical protein
MMTLLALLTGIGIITAVARYNEDEKLLWKLLVSWIGAFAAGTIALSMVDGDSDKQDKVVMIENAPMQALESMPTLYMSVVTDNSLATLGEKSPKPVGKDMLFNQDNIILSEVHRKARGQPQWYTYFSDS